MNATNPDSCYRVLKTGDKDVVRRRAVPNFSLPIAGRGATWRRLDVEVSFGGVSFVLVLFLAWVERRTGMR